MSGLAERLAGETTTLAICWRVARTDGATLGFTTHDRPLDVGGVTYLASPGMAPSAISIGDGLEVDTMEVEGALSASQITAADLDAGRYDSAAVSIFIVDWAAPGAGTMPLARGVLGEVARRSVGTGGAFTAELRGPTAALDATVVETCSPECRAELGDARCRVDLAPLTILTHAGDGEDGQIAITVAAERFAGGRLRVLAGPNAGLDMQLAGAGPDWVEPFEPLPFALAPGTRVELREGCDHRFATCRDRFANALNFRGEPHVPGSDLLTRFPGL